MLYGVIEKENVLSERQYRILNQNQLRTNSSYSEMLNRINNQKHLIREEFHNYLELDNDFEIDIDKKSIKTQFLIIGTDCECINHIDLKIKSKDNEKDWCKKEKIVMIIDILNGHVEMDIF